MDLSTPTVLRRYRFPPRLILNISLVFFLLSLGYGHYWILQRLGGRILQHPRWVAHLETKEPFLLGLRCAVSDPCKGAFGEPEWPLAYFPVLGVLLLTGLLLRWNTLPEKMKSPGSARFAERRDLLPLKEGRQSGYMGFLREEKGGKVLPPNFPIPFPEAIRNGHIAVLGGPGAGKTTAFFLPNLLKDAELGNVAVVFDFKFPDPSGLGEALSYFTHYKRPIWVFTPFEPQSMILPLLSGAETREGALSVAEMLVPKKLQEGPDEFYRNLERALVMVLTYAVVNDPDVPDPSPRELLRRIMEGPEKIRKYILSHEKAEVREWGRQLIEQLTGMARDKQVGITMGLASRFILFDNPRLAAATGKGEGEGIINLKEVFGGKEPGILYIGIPQVEIQGGKGQTLLQLIKRLLDRAILEVAHKEGGKLPHHTVFYLDEFPSFGYLPNMTEMLATMRSRRVSYMISLQDHSQGYAVYGKEEFDAMFGTIQTVVAWPSRLTAQDRLWFSEFLGKTTAMEKSYTEGGIVTPVMTADPRLGRSFKEAARELLTVDEMQTFPPGEGVITTPGIPPIRAHLPFLFQEVDDPRRGVFAHPWAKVRKRIISTYNPMDVLTVQSLKGYVTTVFPSREEDEKESLLFKSWVEQILHLTPKVDKEKSTYVVSRIPKDVDLSLLKTWEAKGWLVSAPNAGFKLTQDGMRRIGDLVQVLDWMVQMDPVFHIARKYKKEGVQLREATIYIKESLAQSLPEDIKALGRREILEGEPYLAFETPILPVL